MKIGLIAIAGVKLQTRRFIELGVTLPQFVNRGQVIAQLPSLALLTIAGATPDGVDVEYLEVDDIDAFVERLPLRFDLVALSTYTARARDAYRLADAYRREGVPVVIGGLHASVLPEEAAEHADAVVIGEAERTWPRLVDDFRARGRAGLRPFYREARPGEFDLAEAPLPRFDLLLDKPLQGQPPGDPLESGSLHRLGRYNRITIQATRGCPWDCDFCAASKLYGPRYRIKPIAKVLLEIDAVRALWRRPFIEFADDNTFVNKTWSKQLLRELSGRDIRYFTETDVSVADDEELLELLYASGCRQLLIGFETPRPAGLLGMDRVNWKYRQHARYLDVIERIQSSGISVCGCFIVGLDADTPAIFEEIHEFVERSRLLEVQITLLTPFPGTRLYDRLAAEGRLLHPGGWERCTLFDLNFVPLRMSVQQLEDGVAELWRKTWNADAFVRRKHYYRRLLRASQPDRQPRPTPSRARAAWSIAGCRTRSGPILNMNSAASDDVRLERLNELSLTRSFTPELDIDWSATTTDDEYESLYGEWSLFVGTGVDESLDSAGRVQFAKYQQMNLMMFTGLLERHGIAALSRLYDLDNSQPFVEYVTHFIKEETYHHTMFTRAVARIQATMPQAAPLPTRRLDLTLRWLFRGLALVPSRRLQSNLTFLLFRFAEQVTMIAARTAHSRIPRSESFINQIWGFHALDEARHLAFDDMILERNRLWGPIAWLPQAMAAPCCVWLSLTLNANEIWIGRQLGLPLRGWHLPRLMRRTQAPFKRRVFGLLSSMFKARSSNSDKEPAARG